MLEGIVNIYKEKGYTSHDVIYRLRKLTHIQKIGHTGTLDPMACGVLPVCFGKATKVCELITDWNKTYVAEMKLGVITDSQDITGNIIKEYGNDEVMKLSPEHVREIILSFIGDIEQVPPMFSAKKINGQKMYDLARKGIEVEREAKKVKVLDIKILSLNLPEIRIEVTCSKGTYIRTICHDIGIKLGIGAVMTSLERTKVGIFDIEKAVTIDEFTESFEKNDFSDNITGIDRLFLKYPEIILRPRDEIPVRHGNFISVSDYLNDNELADGNISDDKNINEINSDLINAENNILKNSISEIYRIYSPSGDFLALYEIKNGDFRPYKMFV